MIQYAMQMLERQREVFLCDGLDAACFGCCPFFACFCLASRRRRRKRRRLGCGQEGRQLRTGPPRTPLMRDGQPAGRKRLRKRNRPPCKRQLRRRRRLLRSRMKPRPQKAGGQRQRSVIRSLSFPASIAGSLVKGVWNCPRRTGKKRRCSLRGGCVFFRCFIWTRSGACGCSSRTSVTTRIPPERRIRATDGSIFRGFTSSIRHGTRRSSALAGSILWRSTAMPLTGALKVCVIASATG